MKTKQLKGVLSTFKIKQADNTVEALKELQENSIGFIAVSSPCSISFPSKIAEKEPISEEHLRQSYRILKRGRFMALFVSHESDYEVKKLAERIGFQIVKTIVRAYKVNNVPAYESCIILGKPVKNKEQNVFPTQFQSVANVQETKDTSYSNTIYVNSGFGANHNVKPLSLVRRLIESLLPKSNNETVLDFFHGTGIAALACIEAKNDCNYLGIEQDNDKCEQSKTLIEEVIKHENRKIRLEVANMRKFFDKRFTLHNGNCVEILKQYPDNFFDSIVCDPPYGISFLNLGWDQGVPPVEIWKECLRVLKPGGYLAAFADTTTQDLMANNIRKAGFDIVDMLTWICSSTMHKGRDVSKDIDKKLGKEADRPIVKTIKNKKSVTKAYHRETTLKPEYHVTTAASEEAKQYEGCSTGLKVACEPITLARKPFTGSFANNVLKHGTGVLNIAACAIPNHPELDKKRSTLRLPSNVIHDGSDAVLEMLEEKARFFYCAKVTKEDRNSGLDPELDKHLLNKHPTVKPHELMKWLVTLLNPVAGMKTLDPFMGSGSTGKAAMALEELNLHFTGIELDPDFCEIAEKRIVNMLNKVNVDFETCISIPTSSNAMAVNKKNSISGSQIKNSPPKFLAKPISIKCIGNKPSKFKGLESLVPTSFDRYIEPLSQNGTLLFTNFSEKRALINVTSIELKAFYDILKSNSREDLIGYIKKAQNERNTVRNSNIMSTDFHSLLEKFKNICSNPTFVNHLKNEINKWLRTKEKERLKTAILGALYYSYRDLYNDTRGTLGIDNISYWFIVNELAHNGMVRYNKKGKFNVPYGKSLDRKNLNNQIDYLIQKFKNNNFKNVSVSNKDIPAFFTKNNNFQKSDFLFIFLPSYQRIDIELIKVYLQKSPAKIMVIFEKRKDIKNLFIQNSSEIQISDSMIAVTNYDIETETNYNLPPVESVIFGEAA